MPKNKRDCREYLLKGLGKEARFVQRYRLPTEAEWEYAARGKNQDEFPWENQDVKNGNGCFYANFKPDRGNYTKDGNLITSRVGIYSANSNGLYDMAGNVAEWTGTVYTEAGVKAMNDLNPQLEYKAAKEDPYRLKKKSVRGGSWKDPESYIRSAWRTWEYQNQPRSYIGFRCVRSLASSSSEAAKEAKKRGIVLELNNSSLNPNSARQSGRENAIKMLEAAKRYGTNIICNTDSHYADAVGDFRNCDTLLREMDFPQELILNNSMEKLKLVLNKSIEEM